MRVETLRRSFLERFDACKHSALLTMTHADAATHRMQVGSAFHAFAAKAIRLMVEHEEPRIEAEMAKELLDRALEEHPELTIPLGEADELRKMAYHFAIGVNLGAREVLCVEQPLTWELSGWTLRSIPDVVLWHEGTLEIWDWKTSWALPTQSEFDHSFQTPLYALHVVNGDTDPPLPSYAHQPTRILLRQLYPRLMFDSGEMAFREMELPVEQLVDRRADVSRLLTHVTRAFATGEWPATPGSHCAVCPAPAHCPLTAVERQYQGVIRTHEDAREIAGQWIAITETAGRLQRALREFAKDSGEIAVGDVELGFKLRESRSVDWKALQDARDAGQFVDVDDFVRIKRTMRFDKHKAAA